MEPDKQDVAIADACMRWARVAQDEIEDIGCWRNADPSDRQHRYWTASGKGDTSPQGFIGDTQRIIMAMTADLPGSDLNAIQTILGAVQSWHEQRSADDLPAQGLLDMKLTMALSSVSAVKHKADIRIVAAQQAGKARRAKPATLPDTSHVVNWTKPLFPKQVAEACGLTDKRQLIDDKRIAREQVKPPGGRKYRYDLDAILTFYGDGAADAIDAIEH